MWEPLPTSPPPAAPGSWGCVVFGGPGGGVCAQPGVLPAVVVAGTGWLVTSARGGLVLGAGVGGLGVACGETMVSRIQPLSRVTRV